MKRVLISELKSHLSEHLRAVQAGQPILVMDRKTPIAKLVPFEHPASGVVIRLPQPGAPLVRDIPMPPAVQPKIDVLTVLEEMRADRDLLE